MRYPRLQYFVGLDRTATASPRPRRRHRSSPLPRLIRPLETAPPSAPAIADPTDPRWVLAVRTAEQLQGPILPPERRERLLRLGKVLGLKPFDTNLIIAIIQDRARRGCPASECPAAGAPQLALITLPDSRVPHRQRPAWATAVAVAAFLVIEALLVLLMI